jgi:hypothetical protein
MQKLLFILGMYYPRYSANGLCSKNVIDKCVSEGFDVICIVNADSKCSDGEVINGARVYRIKPRLYYRISEWCEYHPDSHKRQLLLIVAKTLNRLKLALMSPFWPLIAPLYTYRFYKKARALHKKEHFDVVIAIYTPIDSLLGGHLLKRKYPEIKFIPYYLDALAGGWGPMKWNMRKREKHTRKWEELINRNADLVISMESSKQYHSQNPISLMKIIHRCFLDTPMFLPTETQVKIESDGVSHITRALFAGSIHYPQRNPLPLLEIITRVCHLCDIEFIFVGACNVTHLFQKYSEQSSGRIKHLGKYQHEQVLKLEETANFFINIGSTNPFTIPCKIFEYMRFRKPIISSYAIEDEPSIPYLKKYNHIFLVDERSADIESIAQKLACFIKENKNANIELGSFKKDFYANTPEAFVQKIRETLEAK